METNDLFEVLRDRLMIEISHDTSHEGRMTYIDTDSTYIPN